MFTKSTYDATASVNINSGASLFILGLARIVPGTL